MKAKKLVSALLVMSMALSMAACGGSKPAETQAPAAETQAPEAETQAPAEAEAAPAGDDCPVLTTTDPIKIVFSHNNPATSAAGLAAEKLKEELEARSNGVISVKVYANGELGTVPENDQMLRDGTIQIMSGVSGGLADPSLSYFDLPCLVNNNDEFEALFGRGTELRQVTEEKYNAMGCHVLTLVPAGFGIISSNKEVKNYAELQGLNIRTSQNPVMMEMFKDWGCNATPVDFGELYVALQQGLVEAQCNSLDTTVSSRLYEVQKYIIDARYSVQPLGMYMNLDFYNGLPEDVRALLDWVCENVIDEFTVETCLKAAEDAEKTVMDAGLTIIPFTDEDRAQMKEAAKPVYDMVAETVGQDLINRINELLAQ